MRSDDFSEGDGGEGLGRSGGATRKDAASATTRECFVHWNRPRNLDKCMHSGAWTASEDGISGTSFLIQIPSELRIADLMFTPNLLSCDMDEIKTVSAERAMTVRLHRSSCTSLFHLFGFLPNRKGGAGWDYT